MSLLASQSGTHIATVVLRQIRVDESRRRVPVELGRVLVAGRLQPSTAEDVARLESTGVKVAETARFICRSFPGDDISLVIIDGVTYEVAGSPRRHRSSRHTARDVVYLTAKHQERINYGDRL